jgi:GMP synthase (glutamine-hydrolysing)
MDIPIFGICYGTQFMCQASGGKVEPAESREFGVASINVNNNDDIFKGLDNSLKVWMSHGDQIHNLPEGFETLASTSTCPHAAIRHKDKPLFGVQFHPEVHHTPQGKAILRNFLYEACKASGSWKMSSFIDETVASVRERVGDNNVVLGLSGGVDSSVVAVLLNKALGKQLHCIFVDNGLLRMDEAKKVEDIYRKNLNLNLTCVDATDRFLDKLKGVSDPEKKRKIIGHEFIEVFKDASSHIENVKFLGQGTLYPDVIESVSAHGGPTAVIKSHHNVGGLPAELGLDLIEPLRDLFKDEVRVLGEELGLPHQMVWRHPFPGPGLAVRLLGDISKERLDILRAADKIMIEEITSAGWYDKIWQALCVLLPIQSVGVMGDERTYESPIVVRMVESVDGMTADWVRLPYEIMERISTRIINEVKGVNRVVYDISQKPPATIEWE